MKKLILFGLFLLLFGCSNVHQDSYYICKIIRIDNNVCKYEIYMNNIFQNFYIVDTIGRWEVGDTILMSSQLQKESRAEK